MIWQDFVITVIVYMFVIVTIPQLIDVIKGKSTLNILTTLATSIGNYGLAYIFVTLNLWLSVTSAFLIATLWLFLFIFSMRNNIES
jgi:hypothetical protein